VGHEGDDRLSLPVPPPPNPAARRAAIDAAMRRFDGIGDAPAPRRRRSLAGWASAHRGLAGGLVTAALIAVISIPAVKVAIRDHPGEVATENSLAETTLPGPATSNEAPAPTADQAAAANEAPSSAKAAPRPAQEAEPSSGFVAPIREEKAGIAPPAPMRVAPAPPAIVVAPAPPPPPPPPSAAPQAQADAANDAGNIVVTGSRIRRPNLDSAVPVTVVSGQEIADPFAAFLSELQQAISDNDRGKVARLVALPFHVRIGGERRTYSSSRAIYNDYELIFTPAVRIELLDLRPAGLATRAGGRLRGSGRIWFGCGKPLCADEERIRIREVSP
jgi:hypothetical protein